MQSYVTVDEHKRDRQNTPCTSIESDNSIPFMNCYKTMDHHVRK